MIYTGILDEGRVYPSSTRNRVTNLCRQINPRQRRGIQIGPSVSATGCNVSKRGLSECFVLGEVSCYIVTQLAIIKKRLYLVHMYMFHFLSSSNVTNHISSPSIIYFVTILHYQFISYDEIQLYFTQYLLYNG
jgi:hypothetical protein